MKNFKVVKFLVFAIVVMFCLPTSSFAKVYKYDIGNKELIESLYPSPGKNGYPESTAKIIVLFLKQSLDRDNISYQSVDVGLNDKKSVYYVKIDSNDSRAAHYKTIQPQWLSENISGQALKGVNDCQAAGAVCWNPLNGFGKPEIHWDMFLPFGLPMVSQKMIMLLHYPPYTSLKKQNYLKNNTMYRWERLLISAGIPKDEVNLYETIVDVNPIAAPGSGQSDYLPTLMASFLFDSPENGRNYIGPMLKLLVDPPTNPSKLSTRPVVVFGSQAAEYWVAKYKDQMPKNKKNFPEFGVLDAGKLKLDSRAKKYTPYIGANHPIAAVYQKCTNSYPGIIKMEEQDLATACFVKTLGSNPDADPKTMRDNCKNAWSSPSASQQSLICINAQLDMTPLYKKCTWEMAKEWCNNHEQNACFHDTERPNCYTNRK